MSLPLLRRSNRAAGSGEPRRWSRGAFGFIAMIAIVAAGCVAPAATAVPSASTPPSQAALQVTAGPSDTHASPSPEASPTSASPSPSATSSANALVPPVIATFLVGQRASYSVRLVTADQLAGAQRLQRDAGGPMIPAGTIVRSASADNPGYAWHIDPASFSFENQPSADCEGFPDQIDTGPLASATRFCPTDTTVVRIEPAS